MNDADRFRLHHGPYVPPKCKVGDKLPCEYRGREMTVAGMTDAPIQWPFRKGPGQPSCIVCGDLIRAVQLESEIAVAHHWGVNPATVKHWRRALEVSRTTEGTRRLAIAYTPERLTPEVRQLAKAEMKTPEVRNKIRALKVGKPLHPNMIAALRAAPRKPRSESFRKELSARMKEIWKHPEEHGLPACHHWTDEEIALLGTDHDSVIGERLGIPTHTLENKRRRLRIPPNLRRWTDAEIALLGTRTDREAAAQLGRQTAAVRRKREMLGIPPSSRRWTAEEIALLGTDTDRNIAKKLGRTRSAVETKRSELGRPRYQPR